MTSWCGAKFLNKCMRCEFSERDFPISVYWSNFWPRWFWVRDSLFVLPKVYLNSIKIVCTPGNYRYTSYVKWRDSEHFCCKTQIKYISFRTCVKVSIICPLGKINNLSNCQSWTIAVHGGLLCLHNSKSKAGSSLTWKCACLGRFCQSFFGIFHAVE
jgi:hypothetical protein